ncbi:hypothetical protein GN244_ATG06148 [Phytophthora infestans]|uniref:Uncharacterized protein n=1 Tax=Phytophthora infestans TaxID=4787 RepID=A0A833T104_PHYIN|nr:hypothetical protein GN244_ATG06148 [Phytophthora infestans]
MRSKDGNRNQYNDGARGTTEEGANDAEVIVAPVINMDETRAMAHDAEATGQDSTKVRPELMAAAKPVTPLRVARQPVLPNSSRPMTRANRRRQEDVERNAREKMTAEDKNVDEATTT